MSNELWLAEAPANIALIKYMGKAAGEPNRPTNMSLSYALNHLRTRVEIRPLKSANDQWLPLMAQGWQAPSLSESGQKRYIDHFKLLKTQFGISGSYEIRSANNFPSDAGLASSASSFAALTLAAFNLSRDRGRENDKTVQQLAEISRQGSGSSCRSFFSPWALWTSDGVEEINLGYEDLIHQVIVVEDKKKQVSSSAAHQRVASSLLFSERPLRAEVRAKALIESLRAKDWNKSFAIAWAEFWDMHALFETAMPPFGYMTPGTHKVLEEIQQVWQKCGDGPLVTIDAGPNVHLLYRGDQSELVTKMAHQLGTWFKVFGQ